jgi:hypothetical protein
VMVLYLASVLISLAVKRKKSEDSDDIDS